MQHNNRKRILRAVQKTAAVAVVCLLGSHAHAAVISYRVSGVDEELADNVLSYVRAFEVGHSGAASVSDTNRVIDRAVQRTKAALRPFGYYAPVVQVAVAAQGSQAPVVSIEIDPGPPMLIDDARIEVIGDGAQSRRVTAWREAWPLPPGRRLLQSVWEQQKASILDELARIGFLGATFAEHRIELDLERHRADLVLRLDTGPRYRFGKVDFGEHVLKPGIVEFIPRFAAGDWYSRRLVDTLRLDLWKSGYFTEVEVAETPRADASPPVVNLKVDLATNVRNYFQGSLGVGSDTGTRVQAQISRHPMSANGDRIDIGAGWQEQDDEFSIRSSYRRPRPGRAREFWTGDLTIRDESLDLEVKRRPDDESFLTLANGDVDEYHLRAGRLKVRNFKGGEKQAFETLFVQALKGNRSLTPDPNLPDLLAAAADADRGRLFRGTDDTLSVGIDYDVVAVYGRGWNTRGHRDRAWLFTSSDAIGSDADFTQLYLSTRRSFVRGNRWKLLLRAELGYTDADVVNFSVDVNGEPLDLSVTRLPNFYRFRAGGSDSVRGYGFEELSNNLIGSNHIVTGSAEIEMKFLPNWSAAAFVDFGNAFNDWDDRQLKTGAGIGIRWYSFAGPVRLDVARALDIEDRPWRVHFSVGSPLL